MANVQIFFSSLYSVLHHHYTHTKRTLSHFNAILSLSLEHGIKSRYGMLLSEWSVAMWAHNHCYYYYSSILHPPFQTIALVTLCIFLCICFLILKYYFSFSFLGLHIPMLDRFSVNFQST